MYLYRVERKKKNMENGQARSVCVAVFKFMRCVHCAQCSYCILYISLFVLFIPFVCEINSIQVELNWVDLNLNFILWVWAFYFLLFHLLPQFDCFAHIWLRLMCVYDDIRRHGMVYTHAVLYTKFKFILYESVWWIFSSSFWIFVCMTI